MYPIYTVILGLLLFAEELISKRLKSRVILQLCPQHLLCILQLYIYIFF